MNRQPLLRIAVGLLVWGAFAGCQCVDPSELQFFACGPEGACPQGQTCCADLVCRLQCASPGSDGGGLSDGGDASVDAGGDAGTPDSGYECNTETCANGCCIGGMCQTSTDGACGIGGSACVGCVTQHSDRCSAGACACGEGAPCADGQRCVAGTCICDATSCPSGCCDASQQCHAGTSTQACGKGGEACQTCPNGCASQACVGCDPTSCANGCCQDGVCKTAQSMTQCGLSGSACQGCDQKFADNCSAGQCRCGSGAACVPGQACVGGKCVCNSSTCAGCCSGNQCQSGTSASACGTGGAGCFDCGDSADSCVNGTCRCGGGASCSFGTECSGGSCVCDSNSCPNGCCEADVCYTFGADNKCGDNGGFCMDCPSPCVCQGGLCRPPSGSGITCQF